MAWDAGSGASGVCGRPAPVLNRQRPRVAANRECACVMCALREKYACAIGFLFVKCGYQEYLLYYVVLSTCILLAGLYFFVNIICAAGA